MYTIEKTEQDYWFVISDDLKSRKFEIFFVEKGSNFVSGRNFVKPFKSEEDAIKFIRIYVPYYAKNKSREV